MTTEMDDGWADTDVLRIEQVRLRRLAALDTDQSWSGLLCRQNYRKIAERINRMLDGRRYTFIATMEGRLVPTDVRTGRQLNRPGRVLDDSIHIVFEDQSYVWGLSVGDGIETEIDARDSASKFSQVRVNFNPLFSTDQIQIMQYNGFGKLLCWVIAVEPKVGD